MWDVIVASGGFSAFQYNTTVKQTKRHFNFVDCFSAFQYNTTVKPLSSRKWGRFCFSAFQYNTTVKPRSRLYTTR